MGSVATRSIGEEPQLNNALRHEALRYRTADEYLDGVGGFVTEGLSGGERVLVAVPGEKVHTIRDHLGGDVGVTFIDMRSLGQNPSRIIPAIGSFLDSDPEVPARFVGEPIWAGRGADEIAEATLHESLINLAFASYRAAILCPYDTAGLSRSVLDDSDRTHPVIVDRSGSRPSASYSDPETMCDHDDWPLLPPPADAPVVTLGIADLVEIRHLVADRAEEAGLGPERTTDLLLAVNEVATNALVHGSGHAALMAWVEPGALVCQVHDDGRLDDLLAGRYRPPVEAVGQRGLWMVNQLCDLVELRSGKSGTTLRLRMRLAA